MKIRSLTIIAGLLAASILIVAGCAAPASTSPSASVAATPAATATLAASDAVAATDTAATATVAVSDAVAATDTAAVASATPAAAQETFTGYVIDQKCGISGVDVQNGSDLSKLADKHTLSCAQMPACTASGFGMSIKQADGTYKYYKFDSAGSKLALDSIINKTTKADNLLVEVKGAMSADTITVASIVEK